MHLLRALGGAQVLLEGERVAAGAPGEARRRVVPEHLAVPRLELPDLAALLDFLDAVPSLALGMDPDRVLRAIEEALAQQAAALDAAPPAAVRQRWRLCGDSSAGVEVPAQAASP